MVRTVPLGISDEMTVTTTPEMAATHVATPVYSTPYMLTDVETVCQRMLVPYLEEGENTVGYRADIRHLAPTPIGQRVTFRAKLIESQGRRFVFQVEAHNEAGVKAGEAIHERRLIDSGRFGSRSG
jgi:fluoroacetyl-CoA thioesterase